MTYSVPMGTQTRIEDIARQYQAEVLADIADGIVPPDVATIEELHDYVDANTYAGLCGENADIALDDLIAVQDRVEARPASRNPGPGARHPSGGRATPAGESLSEWRNRWRPHERPHPRRGAGVPAS